MHVNCAALPESLAESELFGHAKGAFSGAVADRPGRFGPPTAAPCSWTKSANCRCWCRLPLRALQNGEIQRLGDDRPRRVDVRIVAATNRSLKDLVRDGDFRADLYHRLSVYPIAIPPLRERGNDVLLLAGRYLEQNRARLGLRSLRLALDAEEALRRYRWPGNVRELEHVISRAAIKAVSRGANRNHIVTLEAGLLDLSGADLRPSRRRRTRRPPRRRTARWLPCATPWTPVSASTSGWRCKRRTATGPRPRACWRWTPATCTNWRAGWA